GYGCAWQASELATTQRKKSITAGRERLRRWAPLGAGARLGPCPPLYCGVARVWRLAPTGGLSSPIRGIPLTFPYRNNLHTGITGRSTGLFLMHGRHAEWNPLFARGQSKVGSGALG